MQLPAFCKIIFQKRILIGICLHLVQCLNQLPDDRAERHVSIIHFGFFLFSGNQLIDLVQLIQRALQRITEIVLAIQKRKLFLKINIFKIFRQRGTQTPNHGIVQTNIQIIKLLLFFL